MTAREKIAAAARDRVSGSTVIALAAADGLAELALEAPEPARFAPAFLDAARLLLSQQPAMAAIWRLVNDCFVAADEAEGPEFAADAVVDAARAFKLRHRRAVPRITHELAALVPRGSTILTLSCSSTLEAAFAAFIPTGRIGRLLVQRSLPGGEGAVLAARIAAVGAALDEPVDVPVEVIEDAACGPAVAAADVLLVGADAISPSWCLNKVGTRPAALLGHATGLRAIVVADTQKMVPSSVAQVIENRIERDPARATFETVPWRELRGWVSEDGMIDPRGAEVLATSVQLHPRVEKVASELAARAPS